MHCLQGRLGDITQEELEKQLPKTLRLLFERLGPTYIKLGQVGRRESQGAPYTIQRILA